MKTHDTVQIRPGACHVQHNTAPEAVTDRSDSVLVDGTVVLQQVLCRVKTLFRLRQVAEHRLHEFFGVIRMIGLFTCAIHIECQRGISQGGKLVGALAGVGVMSPPFVHHQDTGAFSADGVIVGKIAGERFAIHAVVKNFPLNRRLGGQAGKQQCGEQDQVFQERSPVVSVAANSSKSGSRLFACNRRIFAFFGKPRAPEFGWRHTEALLEAFTETRLGLVTDGLCNTTYRPVGFL